MLLFQRQKRAAEAQAGLQTRCAADLVGEPGQTPLQQRLGAHERIHLGQRRVPVAGHICPRLHP